MIFGKQKRSNKLIECMLSMVINKLNLIDEHINKLVDDDIIEVLKRKTDETK